MAGNIGDLEDGAYSLGDELSGGLNGLPTILDEDGDFASTRRLQDTGELGDGLFQDLWRANVDFGDDNHDRNIQSKSNAEVLSVGIVSIRLMGDDDELDLLAHANQAIVGSDHQQAVVGTAAQQTKDCCPQVTLVACQVCEADHFGL